jgi:hypothetical membrane protein
MWSRGDARRRRLIAALSTEWEGEGVNGAVARGVPWWGRVSSVLAPVLLIGGWSLAASRQPGAFDSAQGTISALAALDATDRWVMTAAIASTGVCHAVTAASLRPAASTGRVLLALGGVATVLVAMFPLPGGDGSSSAHTAAAAAAFLLLSLWPLVSWRRVPRAHAAGADAAEDSWLGVPWGLRRQVALGAGGVLVGLLVLFGVVLSRGHDVGLAERLLAGAQALWPLVVVASVPRLRGGAGAA